MKQNGENMLSKDIRVEAFWDEEAQVWVASSNDVPGLITEADTMEHLMQKLKIVIPELLQANGLLNEPGTIDIPIHLQRIQIENQGEIQPSSNHSYYLCDGPCRHCDSLLLNPRRAARNNVGLKYQNNCGISHA
ncbi:MAG: DUF1902 domain-containing protein [Candidatus Methanoperedens sp.]|nr:DUF1902 domain-containing protein [Candidatus Methanoperedens sp.]